MIAAYIILYLRKKFSILRFEKETVSNFGIHVKGSIERL